MDKSKFSITFSLPVEHTSLTIPLIAEVEIHHSEVYYIVKNIKTEKQQKRPILPDIKIKKANGQWVHCDSEKETNLSIEIGKAIDARQDS